MSVALPSTLQEMLQVQMNREMFAALTYKQMRCDLRLAGWYGFHKFFHESEKEELGHARDFDHYLTDRGIRPVYTSIPLLDIPYNPEKPLEYFKKALTLEQQYWEYMNELYEKSEEEDDPDTCTFAYDKIEEQHKSVAVLTTIVQKLTRAGSDISALQDLDNRILKIAEED